MADPNVRRVYSTDGGRVRDEPARRPAPARKAGGTPPPADGFIRLRRETAGRGGKTVTTVSGVPGNDADRAALLKALKHLCGAGGTLEGGVIEVQGDHRERIREHLEALGHRVKLAGG